MNRDQIKGAIALYLSQNVGCDSLRGLQVAEGILQLLDNVPRTAPDDALQSAAAQIAGLKQQLAEATKGGTAAPTTAPPPAATGGA